MTTTPRPRAMPGLSRPRLAALLVVGLALWAAFVWSLVLVIGVVAPAVASWLVGVAG